MDNLQGMTTTEYVLFGLDALVLFFIFYHVLKNIQTMRMIGMFKAMIWVFLIWFGAGIAGMPMTTKVFGTIISYTFLAVIILFPDEFKKMLDKFGRRRAIHWSKEKMLDKAGRKAIVNAVMALSRRREGAFIVIARESDLQDEIDRGETLGEVSVSSEMVQTLFEEGGYYSKGALVVRDNAIISANSLLDIARRDDLIRSGAGNRHLAALQVTHAKDCIAIVVSATTGKITVAGKAGKKLEYMYAMETKHMDIHNGIDEFKLEHIIEGLLADKKVTDDDLEDKRMKSQKLTKEERQEQLKQQREKKRMEKERKREEQLKNRTAQKDNRKKDRERQKVQEEDDTPVSRGFGGYDMDEFK